MGAPARFVILVVTGLTLFGLVVGAGLLLLLRSGELNLPAVVAAQSDPDRFCLFGSAVEEDHFGYKAALLASQPAEVVVLGSSTVLSFRARSFDAAMLNLGRMAIDIEHLERAVDLVVAQPKPPALVLLGLDFWWFNPAWAAGRGEPHIPPPARLEGSYWSLPWSWLLQGRITRSDALWLVIGPNDEARCRFGVAAHLHDDGFGPDGSRYYSSRITREDPEFEDYRFLDTLARIRDRRRRFEAGEAPDVDRLRRAAHAVSRLEGAGSRVIAFLPPLAPEAVAAIRDAGAAYLYYHLLPEALYGAGIEVLDYRDSRASMEGENCDFLDGFHAGERLMERLLHRIAETRQGAALATVLRSMDEAGFPPGWTSRPDSRVTAAPEQDFLGIGCSKAVQPSAGVE